MHKIQYYAADVPLNRWCGWSTAHYLCWHAGICTVESKGLWLYQLTAQCISFDKAQTSVCSNGAYRSYWDGQSDFCLQTSQVLDYVSDANVKKSEPNGHCTNLSQVSIRDLHIVINIPIGYVCSTKARGSQRKSVLTQACLVALATSYRVQVATSFSRVPPARMVVLDKLIAAATYSYVQPGRDIQLRATSTLCT